MRGSRRGAAAGAALLAGLAVVLRAGAQPPTSWACLGAMCGEGELAPFFDRLSRAASESRPVHILQLGDSLTAGDAITGAWRAMLQARYGDGGRGVLPPGRPYPGYVTRQVTVTQTPDWAGLDPLGAERRGVMAEFGLSGRRLTASAIGAEIAVSADAGESFDNFTVCGEGPEEGSGWLMELGGLQREVTASASGGGTQQPVRCETLQADSPQTQARVRAQGLGATLLSWAVLRHGPGVVVSNLGVVGAGLRHLAPGGDAAVATELQAYQPDLIVLAYGVNDGFSPAVSEDGYAQALSSTLRRLRDLAPGVPILVLEAPDAEARTGGPAGAGQWSPPAGLEIVRQAQEEAAREQGVALWRWAVSMGGAGTAASWVAASPPLMRPDHVHLTAAGGAVVAAALQRDLDAALTRHEGR